MAWHDRLLVRRDTQGQSARQTLTRLGRRPFDVTLSPAELQVINDTVSSLDLPSPEDNAPRPEGPYVVFRRFHGSRLRPFDLFPGRVSFGRI
jgi:hypothetical protein